MGRSLLTICTSGITAPRLDWSIGYWEEVTATKEGGVAVLVIDPEPMRWEAVAKVLEGALSSGLTGSQWEVPLKMLLRFTDVFHLPGADGSGPAPDRCGGSGPYPVTSFASPQP